MFVPHQDCSKIAQSALSLHSTPDSVTRGGRKRLLGSANVDRALPPHGSTLRHQNLLETLLGHSTDLGPDMGILLEERFEVLAVHFGQFGIDYCPHGGAAQATEEQRHLAKEIAHLKAWPRGYFDFELALQHQEEGLATRRRTRPSRGEWGHDST